MSRPRARAAGPAGRGAGRESELREGAVAWRAAVAVALLATGASQAFAQPAARADRRVPPPAGPVLIQSVTGPAAIRSQRVVEPLPHALDQRLQRAMDLRASGLPDRARDTLLVLLRLVPHHPAIVTELGRTHLAREDWPSLERLAAGERMAQRDSALLAQELCTALERLGRPREAMRVAAQAWVASQAEGVWAAGLFFRLAPVDARLAVGLLESAAGPRPWRSDLSVGLARLHALAGRPDDAMRVLSDTERRSGRSGLRVMFADEALRSARPADTTAALAVLADLAADPDRRQDERLVSGRRAWSVATASGREAEWVARIAAALRPIPGERWGSDLLLGIVRALHRTGLAAEARALLAANPGLERRMPELALEQALAVAREGEFERAIPLLDSLAREWPAARFMLGEVQFFSGALDSAHANFDRVSARPEDPDAGAALDRLYLLEERPAAPARALLGRVAYERWRGARATALRLADSLWRAQSPHGDYAAHVGIELAALRSESGDARGALVPLLVIADSLAGDRLAPLARQRAGDAYTALGDDRSALAQYEECLARYPRAWNSAEVRRRVERLRRARS
jgi:tetratricopeptide (TPR) repeat protein